jgi:hypothetical protein
LRILLELVQTQQYAALLLDDLVKAYPKADQDQQEEHYGSHVENNPPPSTLLGTLMNSGVARSAGY